MCTCIFTCVWRLLWTWRHHDPPSHSCKWAGHLTSSRGHILEKRIPLGQTTTWAHHPSWQWQWLHCKRTTPSHSKQCTPSNPPNQNSNWECTWTIIVGGCYVVYTNQLGMSCWLLRTTAYLTLSSNMSIPWMNRDHVDQNHCLNNITKE